MEDGPKLSLIFKTKNSDKNVFDYSQSGIITVKHETEDKSIYYCRTLYTNKIVIYEEQKYIDDECQILFRARKSKKGYYELIWPIAKFDSLDEDNLDDLDNKIWFVVKSDNNENNQIIYENENDDYYLNENDIIKIAKKKYEVIKLNIVDNNDSEESKKNNFGSVLNLPSKKVINPRWKNQDDEDGYNPDYDCRICFGSMTEINNPLLKMCNCHSVLHYSCLKLFLKNNLIISNNSFDTVTSYKCENFGCEVCKQPYPLYFNVKFDENDEKTFCLIDGLNLPENLNYMILESLTFVNNEQEKNSKYIFVIKLTEKEVKIGRNNENDIIDSESMISRFHAVLNYDKEKGKVSITNKGKFGVSVLIKNNVKLEIGQKIYFQVGRTYIKAEVKKS